MKSFQIAYNKLQMDAKQYIRKQLDVQSPLEVFEIDPFMLQEVFFPDKVSLFPVLRVYKERGRYFAELDPSGTRHTERRWMSLRDVELFSEDWNPESTFALADAIRELITLPS